MNQKNLVNKVCSGLPFFKKQGEMFLARVLEVITEEIKNGGTVRLTSFGTFSAKVRHARNGINPQNPSEKIQMPEVTIPKFKAGYRLKQTLKKKDVQPA